jgi:Protein of unknown function (DUF1488)
MALNFPNRSRTYDQRGSRVQFWGHDGAFEICFFIEQAALGQITPDAKRDEGGFLKAFDRQSRQDSRGRGQALFPPPPRLLHLADFGFLRNPGCCRLGTRLCDVAPDS